MSTDMDLEQTVQAYMNIRAERERIAKIFESEDAALKAAQNGVKETLLEVCNRMNVESIRTTAGTVMRSLKERYYTNDWDNFGKFVLEHEAVELFERRIHQGNMKEFLTEHSKDGLPPGVNVMREYDITVRKPSK